MNTIERYVLYPESPEWKHLFDVQVPPKALYVECAPENLEILKRLPDRGVALVGTRNMGPRSEQFVRKSVAGLTGTDLIVVSGFARGVDGAAHVMAYESGVPTVAVLGCGLNIDYPYQHAGLRQALLTSRGVIVSEFPPTYPALPKNFKQRNRLIAGWSRATVVIESEYRSGALNTASWARDMGRETFAVPCYPEDPKMSGNRLLIERDHAVPFWSIDSLSTVWPEYSEHWRKKMKTSQNKNNSSDVTLEQLKLHDLFKSSLHRRGSITVLTLIEEAMKFGWTIEHAYSVLHETIESGLIQRRDFSLF